MSEVTKEVNQAEVAIDEKAHATVGDLMRLFGVVHQRLIAGEDYVVSRVKTSRWVLLAVFVFGLAVGHIL